MNDATLRNLVVDIVYFRNHCNLCLGGFFAQNSEIIAATFKEVCLLDGYHGGAIPLHTSIVVFATLRLTLILSPIQVIIAIPLMDAYLERSKAAPLEIRIVGAIDNLGNVYNVVSRLSPHSG